MSRVTLSISEKIGMISNISTMLEAGIPIAGVVESLLEEATGNQKKVLLALQDDLTAGKHLYSSFEKFPHVFNKVTVNLVRAAEEAGTLETTLKDIRHNLEEEQEFSDKVKSALFYPVLVMVVFVLVLIVMLVVVVPKVSKVFGRLSVELPLPTKIMIAMSNALINNSALTIGSVLGFFVAIGIFYYYKKSWVLGFVFSLPVVSSLMKQIDVTRFARSMHLLLSSGLPITVALELAEEVILKKDILRLVQRAREQAVAGHPFSEGLRSKKKLFPSMMVKLMEVGEKTGTLEASMQNVSEHMDYEVTKQLKKVTTLLEPIMLVFVGVAVGGMMMAIIAPIYGLIGEVGAR